MDTRINAPRLGLIAEEKFILKCLELEYDVYKPIASYSKADLIIDIKNNIYKIQIKSTYVEKSGKPGNYSISTTTSGKNYNETDVDFFACYIQPLDEWYIFPYHYVGMNKVININKNDLSSDIHFYKENWNILLDKIVMKHHYDKWAETKKIVIDDYNNGMSITDISIKHNLVVRTIREWVKSSDRYISKKKTASKSEILKLYNEKKLTMEQIAVELGLTLWTTRKLFRKYGIKTRVQRK